MDYDNDGDLDLSASGQDGSNYRFVVFRNDGDTFIAAAEPMGVNAGVTNSSFDWGDYDGDGDADLAVSGLDGADYRLVIYRNDAGSFSSVFEPLGTSKGVYRSDLAWGDYDNDGDLDLAVCGADDNNNERLIIFRNDGDTFVKALEPMGAGQGVRNGALAWGDYDNDGDLDLAVSGNDGSNARFIIFENDGGSFSLFDEPRGANSGVEFSDLAWGDYDNDGDLELAILGEETVDMGGMMGWTTNKYLYIYTYEGNSFSNTNAAGLTGCSSGHLAWGDLNTDGNLDLVVSAADNNNDALFIVYRNNGDNTFTNIDEPFGADNGLTNGGLALADYDRDGDLDLAVSGWGTSNRRLILYESNWSSINVNTPPPAPVPVTAAGAKFLPGKPFEFVWEPVMGDDYTTGPAMSYNLRVGTDSSIADVMAADVSSDTLGSELLGNVQNGDSALLNIIRDDTYYWAVQAVDGGKMRSQWSSVRSFEILNDTPVITPPVPDQVEDEDTSAWEIPLSNYAGDTQGDPLKWIVTGGGTVATLALVDGGYSVGGKDTLIITPVANASGTDSLTILLGDGKDTASQPFSVFLNPVEDTPTIDSPVFNQQKVEDADSWTIGLSSRASDIDGDQLKWIVDSVGTVVSPSLAVNDYRAGGVDTLTLTPFANTTGIDTVTLQVGDGSCTVSQQFTVRVDYDEINVAATVQSDSSKIVVANNKVNAETENWFTEVKIDTLLITSGPRVSAESDSEWRASRNFRLVFPLLAIGEDTVTIDLWTNQSPFTLFYGLRTDTNSVQPADLPGGISSTDTGLRAFGRTAFLLEFADSASEILGGDTVTTQVGDSFAYVVEYDLSETTARLYRDLGFDTAAGSSNFKFNFADTFAANWQADSSTVDVDTNARGGIRVRVAVLDKDLPGALGGDFSQDSGEAKMSSGDDDDDCVIGHTFGKNSSLTGVLRNLRDRLLKKRFGRAITEWYYGVK